MIPRLNRRVAITVNGKNVDVGTLSGWLVARKASKQVELVFHQYLSVWARAVVVSLMTSLTKLVLDTKGAIKRKGESGTWRDCRLD
jgi:hypothetical protein